MCGNPIGTLTDLAQTLGLAPQGDASVRVAAPPQITCAHCHLTVNATYDWCPHCGSSLRATACVYCGRRVAAGLDDCPSCGAPVLFRATP